MIITGNTRIYGVIGDPIAQIRTPELINPIFESNGRDIVAVPFHVHADDLPLAWDAFRRIESIAGLGVTVPHKIPAMRLCDSLGPTARRVGAVGAVRREADGRMVGDLLEGAAFVNSLRALGHRLEGRRVLIVGCGGAGHAIAFALSDAGVGSMTLSNRTAARAQALADRLRDHVPVRVAQADPDGHDIVVNCTSLGMRAADPLPLDMENLTPETVVVDVIHTPEETALVSEARRIGCHAYGGRPMIEHHVEMIARFVGRED